MTAYFRSKWLAISPPAAPLPPNLSLSPTSRTINPSASRILPSGAQSSSALPAVERFAPHSAPHSSITSAACKSVRLCALLPYIRALRGRIHNHLVLAQEPERRVVLDSGIGHHIDHRGKCRGFPCHIRNGNRVALAIHIGFRTRLLAERHRFRATGVGSDTAPVDPPGSDQKVRRGFFTRCSRHAQQDYERTCELLHAGLFHCSVVR